MLFHFPSSNKPAPQRRRPVLLGIEQLENRLTPSAISFSNGSLFITDPSNANDNVQVTATPGGGAGVSSNLGSGTFGPVVAVVFSLGNGNDHLGVDSLPGAFVSITAGNGNDHIEIGNETSIFITIGSGNNNITTYTAGFVEISVTGNGNNHIAGGTGTNQIAVGGNGNNHIKASGTSDLISVLGNGNNDINDKGTNDIVQLGGNGNNNISNEGAGSVTEILFGTGHNKIDGPSGTTGNAKKH